MKQKTKIILTILFLPSMIAELLSGSAPPLEFFRPLSFFFWILLYGCGVLLIREMKIRWNMQWSVIFLAITYGILEEGLTTKAFFNSNWADAAVYAHCGTFLGVLIPWSIVLLIFHATLSTLIPILIVDLTWPRYKKTTLVGKGGLIFALAGLIAIIIFGLNFMGTSLGEKMIPYRLDINLFLGSVFSVLILIFAGYRFRNSKIYKEGNILKAKTFALLSFLFMFSSFVVPLELAKHNVDQSILLSYQILIIIITFLFTYFQIYNKNITKNHLANIVFGSLLFWIIIAIILEVQGSFGMSLVGATFFTALLIWKKGLKAS